MAIHQATVMLDVLASSRASPLPQGNADPCRSELVEASNRRDGRPDTAGRQIARVIVKVHRGQVRSYRELRNQLSNCGNGSAPL